MCLVTLFPRRANYILVGSLVVNNKINLFLWYKIDKVLVDNGKTAISIDLALFALTPVQCHSGISRFSLLKPEQAAVLSAFRVAFRSPEKAVRNR